MNIIHPPTPAWKGPFVDGITQSLMSTFLTCPFQFYLYAYCGLEESKQLEPNLIWGDILHKGLEHRVRGDSLEDSIDIMWNYQKTLYPTAPATYRYTTRNMLALYPIHKLESWGQIETEVSINTTYEVPAYYRRSGSEYHYQNQLKWETPPYPSYHAFTYPEPVRIRGKVDMLSQDRNKIGDHKAKGKFAAHPDSVKEELNQDLQMNLYSYFMGKIEHWFYDLIKIPEALPRTPPRKVSETPEQWADRIFHTYSDINNGFPIKKCPGMWFNQINHFQPEENIELFMRYTINPLIIKIIEWWEHVTHPKFDPLDPLWYNSIFYRAPVRNFNPTSTYSYKCRYHSFLIGKETFENLIPVRSFYPELETK
jgi:hypothetical protein